MLVLLWEAPLGDRRAPDPCLDTCTEPTTWPGWWWCVLDSSNVLPALSRLGAVGNHLSHTRTNYMLLLTLPSPKWRICFLLLVWETSALLTSHPEKGCCFQVSYLNVPCGLSFLGQPLPSLVHGSHTSDLFEYQSWHPGSWLTCDFFLCKDAPTWINEIWRGRAALRRGWGTTMPVTHRFTSRDMAIDQLRRLKDAHGIICHC